MLQVIYHINVPSLHSDRALRRDDQNDDGKPSAVVEESYGSKWDDVWSTHVVDQLRAVASGSESPTWFSIGAGARSHAFRTLDEVLSASEHSRRGVQLKHILYKHSDRFLFDEDDDGSSSVADMSSMQVFKVVESNPGKFPSLGAVRPQFQDALSVSRHSVVEARGDASMYVDLRPSKQSGSREARASQFGVVSARPRQESLVIFEGLGEQLHGLQLHARSNAIALQHGGGEPLLYSCT